MIATLRRFIRISREKLASYVGDYGLCCNAARAEWPLTAAIAREFQSRARAPAFRCARACRCGLRARRRPPAGCAGAGVPPRSAEAAVGGDCRDRAGDHRGPRGPERLLRG